MHQPKRLVLTKREGHEIRAALFTEASTREQEQTAFDLVREEGWMCHAFRPSNVGAIQEAIDMHHEIEMHNHHRIHTGTLVPG